MDSKEADMTFSSYTKFPPIADSERSETPPHDDDFVTTDILSAIQSRADADHGGASSRDDDAAVSGAPSRAQPMSDATRGKNHTADASGLEYAAVLADPIHNFLHVSQYASALGTGAGRSDGLAVANTTELSSKRRLVLVKDRNDGQHVQFWVCTDGILLSQIVPLYQDSFPRNQLNKAMHPRWATDTCFWLAFVPRDLVFKGRLFESLKFPAPLVDSPFRLLDGSTGQHYKVSEEVGRKWSQLGIMLNELRSLLTLTIDALPPTIECPPAPSEHRYEKLFADRKSADEALDETRWSFILQMAYISCLYHLLPPPVTGLVWSQIPDGTKISLQSSWIFANDGRTTRVGAFVDTTQDGQWLQYFDTISSVPGLPLWLHYPTVSTTLAHPTFERYAPWTGFGPTWQGNRGNFDSEPSGWSAAPTPLHETQATFSPDEAFGHPAQRGASREQSPSPAMRRQGPSSYPSHRQRFQRGRGQSRSPRLVRDQSRGAGHRQSTRQEQGRSHSHLRQQSHRGSDERDLPLLREAQRSSASSVRAHQSPPLCPPPRYLSAGTHAFDPGRMSTAFRTLLANDKIVEDAITVDPILTVLQCRYGFKPDVSYISDKFAQEKRIKNSATFLHRILGFDIKNDNIPAALINAVDDFAGLLRHGFPPPVQLCDLMVDGRGDFVRALGSPMLATKVKLEALPDANPRDVYLIKPRDVEDAEDWPWHLIVESSLTAAEILRRRWGPHKASVVRELAKRGIPFRVALPAPSKQSLSLPPVTISGLNAGLGVRQPNFRTSKEEYLTFEDQRKDLLVNSPHAVQAALGAGGIIWRLTVNTLQPDLAAEGPRDRPDQQATVLLDGESYICDALTSHEEDLICGVYRVLASNTESSATDYSWWPKGSTWLKSGADLGYWTSFNEFWFQKRLQEIRAGTATPHSATQWRGYLKFDKSSSSLIMKNLDTMTAVRL